MTMPMKGSNMNRFSRKGVKPPQKKNTAEKELAISIWDLVLVQEEPKFTYDVQGIASTVFPSWNEDDMQDFMDDLDTALQDARSAFIASLSK